MSIGIGNDTDPVALFESVMQQPFEGAPGGMHFDRLFETLIKRRPNAFLIQTFFDAKAEEIRNIFSDGPKVDIVSLKETLNRVAPFYASTWNEIKY